jgi:protease I
VKSLIAEFDRSGKLIAAICHGGWMVTSSGAYKRVKVTGSPGIKDVSTTVVTKWQEAKHPRLSITQPGSFFSNSYFIL